MTSQTRRLYLLLPVLVALSACSTVGGNDATSPKSHGAILLAISEKCTEVSESQCVSVNGESIVLPSTYEPAGVEAAAVATGEGQSAVDVTFTDHGAAVLHTLTEQAAGGTSRLVMKAGDKIIGAVVVAEALQGEELQIGLSPDASAQEIVDLIQRD